MKSIWVLVAGEANARILEKPLNGVLIEVTQLLERCRKARTPAPDSRRQKKDDDEAASHSVDMQRHCQAQAFAERIALKLEEYREEGRFDELHVVATARTIGYLRPELAPRVKSAIVRTLDKDWQQETEEELTRRLFSSGAV